MWFSDGDVFKVVIQGLVVYAIYYAFWASIIRPGIRRHTGEAALAAGSPPAAPSPPHRRHQRQPSDQQTAAWPAKQPAATGLTRYEEAQRRRRSRTNWRDRVNQQLAAKPLREKLTELLGSMLLAAVFAAIASSRDSAIVEQSVLIRSDGHLCLAHDRRHTRQLGHPRAVEVRRGQARRPGADAHHAHAARRAARPRRLGSRRRPDASR